MAIDMLKSLCKRDQIIDSFITTELDNTSKSVQVIEANNYLIITNNLKIIEKYSNLEVIRQAEEGVSFEKGNVEPILNYELENKEILELVENFSKLNNNYSVAYFYDAMRYSSNMPIGKTMVLANNPNIIKDYIEPFTEVHQKRFPQVSGVVVNIADCVQETTDTTILSDKEHATKRLDFLFNMLEIGMQSCNLGTEATM